MKKPSATIVQLVRIADALERLAPVPVFAPALDGATAFVWAPDTNRLVPVEKVNRVDIDLLQAIDRQKDILLANTGHFASGHPANNALLWGARGMGKSSLVKAVHQQIGKTCRQKLNLIEIHREDIASLPTLMGILRQLVHERFILFCDDLSFDNADTSYKSLKAVLEGGIEGRPEHVIFYATSNRRHLMPRDMIENERSTAINPAEAVEEKVSLSDRFGLWIGFHNCSQAEYLQMVLRYARFFKIPSSPELLEKEAIEWAATRGARSGRVAWQFIVDLAGRKAVKLN